MTIPNELKDLIMEYHGSMVEFPKRCRVHLELYHHFAGKLWQRVTEEFLFIFYPGFYSDLQIAVMPIEEGDSDTDVDGEPWI